MAIRRASSLMAVMIVEMASMTPPLEWSPRTQADSSEMQVRP